MTEAASRIKIHLIVSLCKLPCLYGYSIVTPEEQIWILLLSLAFGITEAVLGFLAFGSLFTSLETVGVLLNVLEEITMSVSTIDAED